MHLDRGFVSPYFATNVEKMICEMEDPFILLTTKKITNINQILKILEGAARSGHPLFIVADDIEGEALTTLILNRMRGTSKVCAIKAPGFGEDNRFEILKDIAVLTNSQPIVDETGDYLEDVELISGVIGSAKRIIVGKNSTTIFDGAGDKADVTARINFIESQILEADSEYAKEKLQARVEQLLGTHPV